MNIITSNAHFRQRVIKKSYKVGVTEASKYYRVSRNAYMSGVRSMTARVGKVLLIKVIVRIITQTSIPQKKRR